MGRCNQYRIIKKHTLTSEDYELLTVLFDICRQEISDVHIFTEAEENYYYDLVPYCLVLHQDKIVGFLSVFVPNEDECQIYINILQNHINTQTVGKGIETIKEECKKHKIRHISVVNSPENRKMTEILQKIGLKYIYSDVGMYMELQDFFVNGDVRKQNVEIETEENKSLYETTFIAYHKDEYIGEISVYREQNVLCIYGVYIEEEYRGRGYGKYLLSYVLSEAVKNGAKEAMLHVTSDNKAASGLYEKMGFKNREKIDRWETTVNE